MGKLLYSEVNKDGTCNCVHEDTTQMSNTATYNVKCPCPMDDDDGGKICLPNSEVAAIMNVLSSGSTIRDYDFQDATSKTLYNPLATHSDPSARYGIDNCECGSACKNIPDSDCYKCCANIRPSVTDSCGETPMIKNAGQTPIDQQCREKMQSIRFAKAGDEAAWLKNCMGNNKSVTPLEENCTTLNNRVWSDQLKQNFRKFGCSYLENQATEIKKDLEKLRLEKVNIKCSALVSQKLDMINNIARTNCYQPSIPTNGNPDPRNAFACAKSGVSMGIQKVEGIVRGDIKRTIPQLGGTTYYNGGGLLDPQVVDNLPLHHNKNIQS